MGEEEVLGEEEVTQEDEGGGRGAAVMDTVGDLADSFLVKILLGAIALIAIVLVVVAVTFWTFEGALTGTEPEEDRVADESPGAILQEPMGTFELEDEFVIVKEDPRTGRRRTLRLVVVLGFDQDNQSVRSELEQRRSQVRDIIHRTIGGMDVEEVGYHRMEEMEDRLVSEINRVLTGGHRIQAVFFSDFVYQ